MIKLCSFLAATLLLLVSAVFAEDCIEAKRLVKKGVQLGDGSDDELEFYKKAREACASMAEAPYNSGVIYLQRGEVSQAIAEFRKALDIREEERYRSGLASAYLAAREYTKAEKEYREALDRDPSSVVALQGLALISERQGDLNQAVKFLEKARKFEPTNIVSTFNLAVLHEKLGNFESAQELYLFVLKQDAAHVRANVQLGVIMQRLGHFKESIPYLEKAVVARPELGSAHRALGVAYEHLSDLAKAELAFQKASRLDPQDIDSRINLAVILIKQEKQALAEEILRGVLDIDSSHSRALSVLGWAQLELGNYKEAEDHLTRALATDASNARAHNNLGVLYQRLGKEELAKKEFSKAYQLDPGLDPARENFERFRD